MDMWAKLLGDKSRFAIGITFSPDPDKGVAATEEESASWGAFELWVNGVNLCSHYEEGERVEAVHWYLLPLLEWLVQNWDPLFHEEHLPFDDTAVDASTLLQRKQSPPLWFADDRALGHESIWYDWWQRHSLQACREGGLFPNVTVRRWRELLEVSWDEVRLPGVPEGFSFLASRGYSRLDPLTVAEPLYAVVSEAVSFVTSKVKHSERMSRLVDAVACIPKTKREVRLAWMAGLGHFWNDIHKSWMEIYKKFSKLPTDVAEAVLRPEFESPVLLGSCKASLMFGSVSPTISANDALSLADKLVSLFDEAGDRTKLKQLVREEPLVPGDEPWDQGYRLALEAHDVLGLDPVNFVDVKRIVAERGVFLDAIALEDEAIRAIAVAGPKHRTSIILNRSNFSYANDARERFTLAHELCHLLFDRAYGKMLALASGPWAPEDLEARANAFAAMFLMPPSLIDMVADRTKKSLDSVEGVKAVAEQLGTSFTAAVEHLCNLKYFDASTRDKIKEQRMEQGA